MTTTATTHGAAAAHAHDHAQNRFAVPRLTPAAVNLILVSTAVRVDGARWTADRANGFKEPDGFGGLNSILNLA